MMRWRYLRSAFSWWFGLIWAAVGTPFFFIGIWAYQDARHFNAMAVAATATVVEKGHDTNSKGDSHYWMRYSYHDAAGAEHVGVADVKWEVWRRYADGNPVAIRYASDKPDDNKLNAAEAGPWWVLPLAFGGAGLVFGGTGWFLVWRAIIKAGERVALLRHGVSALASVTGVELNLSVTVNGRHPRYLAYEFYDDAQAKHQGRSSDLPRRMEDRWKAGDPILVVFDRNNPEKSEADIFGVREQQAAGLRGAQ